MSKYQEPLLLELGNSADLLRAMRAIIASPEEGLDEQSRSLLEQHQNVLREAFRQALSEAVFVEAAKHRQPEPSTIALD